MADDGSAPSVASGGAPLRPRSPFALGDRYDKALAEAIIGLFKAQIIHHLMPLTGFSVMSRDEPEILR